MVVIIIATWLYNGLKTKSKTTSPRSQLLITKKKLARKLLMTKRNILGKINISIVTFLAISNQLLLESQNKGSHPSKNTGIIGNFFSQTGGGGLSDFISLIQKW